MLIIICNHRRCVLLLPLPLLLQDDEAAINLDEWVINTEAHLAVGETEILLHPPLP